MTPPPHPALSAPIVGGAVRPQNDGYWLLGQDGGIFAFGAAPAFTDPVVGKLAPGAYARVLVCTASGEGLYVFCDDGGVLCFGDATYHGSIPGLGIGQSSAPIQA